jgi:hypothetical protein
MVTLPGSPAFGELAQGGAVLARAALGECQRRRQQQNSR